MPKRQMFGLLVVSMVFLPGDLMAQPPQQTTATFDDWVVVCAMPSVGEKLCEMVHVQTAQDEPNPVGRVIIGRAPKNGAAKLFMQTPPNVWFETGVKFVLDEKDTVVSASLRWCTATRCQAEADLSSEMLAKLRKRTDGQAQFKESTQRDVSTPISFKGFVAALDYMERQ